MIDLRTVVLVAGLGLGSAVCAQEPGTPPQAAGQEAQRGSERWIRDLGSESYRTRLQAEKELRKLGDKALPDLKKAAEESEDHEVQWRARRLIRQIEGGDQGLQQRQGRVRDEAGQQPRLQWWGDRQGLPDPIRRQFDQLFREMEQQFGLDIPRARFFQDDFFQDLDEQMKAGTSRSQGMSVQIGPDGAVRVEVKEADESGKVETKVYEAPDLQTFEQQYPGVLGKNGLGFGLRAWPLDGPPALRDLLAPRMERLQRRNQPGFDVGMEPEAEAAAPPEGKRLGAIVRPEIPAGVREYLELEDGVGLMIEGVQPGSLAEAVGLRQGDIVVRIAGRPVGGTQDVQEALGGVEVGASVEVRFLRKGVEKVATAPKPEAKTAPAEPPHGKAERLQRRDAGAGDGIR
jgi:hypothetical protein